MTHFADTPPYREAIERQHEITETAAAVWDLDYLETADEAAPVDAVLARQGLVRAVVEVKSRNLTRDEFLALGAPPRSPRGNSGYLITEAKLIAGAGCAAALLVPYVVLVGLYPSREVLYWHAWGPPVEGGVPGVDDGWLVRYHTDTTRTPRSVDGGSRMVKCAFLDISQARPL